MTDRTRAPGRAAARRALRGTVVVVGPMPPPVFGPSVATATILRAFANAGVRAVNVNTQDRRTVFNTGVLDRRNVSLGILHTAQLLWRAGRPGVDVVYVPISQGRWGYVRDACLMLVARICRRSLVVHLHGAVFQDFYASANRIERWMIRRTLAWVTLGIALTPSLRRTFAGLVPPERLRVLENAIEDPFAGRSEHVLAERERRRSRDEGLRILYVANDFATKGADTLVRALACLRTPRARLRMIGAPPPEVSRATQTLADVLGVGDRVELLGGLTGEEKLRHFEWADVFAYPTENDGQPLVVIEAMAAGLAIVASTFGGVPETVGEAALLVPPGEPERLAESLDRLAEDPELRLKLGRAARRRYVARYTPEPFQAHFEALFADVLPG